MIRLCRPLAAVLSATLFVSALPVHPSLALPAIGGGGGPGVVDGDVLPPADLYPPPPDPGDVAIGVGPSVEVPVALESVGEGVAEVGSPGAWLPGQADAPEFAAVDVVVPVGEPTSAVGQESVALSVAESIATALPVRILPAESPAGEVNALGERPGEELASAPVSPAEVRLSGLS